MAKGYIIGLIKFIDREQFLLRVFNMACFQNIRGFSTTSTNSDAPGRSEVRKSRAFFKRGTSVIFEVPTSDLTTLDIIFTFNQILRNGYNHTFDQLTRF